MKTSEEVQVMTNFIEKQALSRKTNNTLIIIHQPYNIKTRHDMRDR